MSPSSGESAGDGSAQSSYRQPGTEGLQSDEDDQWGYVAPPSDEELGEMYDGALDELEDDMLYRVGDRVIVKGEWPDCNLYAGVVEAVAGVDSYVVSFDDGTREDDLTGAAMRPDVSYMDQSF